MARRSSDGGARLAPLIEREGTPRDDQLIGTADEDRLIGRGGDDFLSGLAGPDLLVGNAGDDQLFGGDERDQLVAGRGADVMSGGADNDELHGQSGADDLDGDAGHDLLLGGGGVDRMHGGAGSDTLIGDGAGDRLFGDADSDLLDGKTGRDTLTGGDGIDLFAFTVLDGKADRITDFDVGQGEILDVSALLPQLFGSDLNDFVRQTDTDGGLLIQISQNGIDGFVDLALLLDVGPVRLDAQQLGADPTGDPDTFASIAPGGEVRGQLAAAGDTDWYRIELVGGQTYRFDQQGQEHAEGTLRDPLLRLYDAGGEFVAQNDDLTGLDSQLTFTAPVSGTYFLSPESFGDDDSGSYRLSATALEPTELRGDNSTTAAISDHGNGFGEIEAAGDTDWYAITLAAGHAYTFDLLGSDVGGSPLADPFLAVYTPNGAQRVAENDNFGDTTASHIEFTPDVDGVFFLQASGAGEGTGRYELVTATPDSDQVPDFGGGDDGEPIPLLTLAAVFAPGTAAAGGSAAADAAPLLALGSLLAPDDPAQAAAAG